MDRSTGNAVIAAGIDGVFVVAEPRRAYPAGPLLGPVLGFTGVATPQDVERWPDLPPGEVVGRAGLEQQYDAVLRGINGRQCLYVDPKGVPVALGERQDPVPGADLRLSIDLGLQQQLDTSLAAAVRAQPRPRGRIGAAVAMDPRSGQILAMASTPSFDNNIYGPPVDTGALQGLAAAPGSPMLEHVTQAVAPPGSTFKLVVAAANQAHPVFAPRRAIPTGADFTYGGHTFGNWKPMGPMNMVQSLAISNDVYFYKLAVALGPDAMIDTARALGVGERTGIDLPGESAGYLGTPESVRADGGTWYGGSTVILGIGQGYLQVTPLQNARWTAAVATGNLVTPRLGHGGRGRGGHVHGASRSGRDAGAVRRRAGAGPRGDAGGRDGRYRGPARRPSCAGRREDRHCAGRRPPRGELRQLDECRRPDRRSRDRGDRAGSGAGRGWQQREERGGRRSAPLPRAPHGRPRHGAGADPLTVSSGRRP